MEKRKEYYLNGDYDNAQKLKNILIEFYVKYGEIRNAEDIFMCIDRNIIRINTINLMMK